MPSLKSSTPCLGRPKADPDVQATCYEIPHGSGEYWESVKLRDSVLRKPLGLAYKQADLLAEEGSYHLICREGDGLLGCLVLKPAGDGIVKMRQFAVSEASQGKGIGRLLENYAMGFAKDKGFTEVQLHAREAALGFYQKLGYHAEGERFLEVTIPHFAMRKQL